MPNQASKHIKNQSKRPVDEKTQQEETTEEVVDQTEDDIAILDSPDEATPIVVPSILA